MSKKQASLLSFFKSSGTPTSSPKTFTPTRSLREEQDKIQEEPSDSPLRPQCNREGSTSPMKPRVKRRRILMSSDEDDDENTVKRPAQVIKQEPKTPTNRKYTSRYADATPKSANRSQIRTDMAESFISSFKFSESVNASCLNESTSNMAAAFERKNNFNLVGDRYDHEDLPWLKPENVKDANMKKPTDPEYDPSTLYVPSDFLKKQTPGHRQWWQIKSANYDTVLLFKVGKFYELYHMDAVIAVNCLSLSYMKGTFAHAGFPEAAYGKFADQLVARGYKVARVEQTETPQQLEERNNQKGGAKEKVVKRELCRITTAGTKTYGVLDGETNGIETLGTGSKYLFAVKEDVSGKNPVYGVCFIDTSVGQFNISQFEDDDYRSFLRTLLAKYNPAQLLLERGHVSSQTTSILNTLLTSVPKEYLSSKKQFPSADDSVSLLTKEKYLGTSDWPTSLKTMLDVNAAIPKASRQFTLVWSSIGAVLGYLERCLIDVDMITMKNFNIIGSSLTSKKLNLSEDYWNNRQLVLDGITIFNLNLLPSDDVQASNMSLFNTMNHCSTSFGRRLFRQWICSPSCDPSVIEKRQAAVEFVYSVASSTPYVKNIVTILKELPDLERLLQKIHTCGLKYRAESHPDSRAVMFEATKYNSRKIKNLALAVEGFSQCFKIFQMEKILAESNQAKQFPDSYDLLGSLLSESFCIELGHILKTFKDSVDLKKALEAGKIEPNEGADKDYDEANKRVEICENNIENYRKSQEELLKCRIIYWGNGKNRYQMEIPDSKNVSSKYELKSRRKGVGRYQTDDLMALIGELEAAEQYREKQADESSRRVFEEFDSKRAFWSQVVDRIATLDVIISLAKYAQTCTIEVCRPQFDFHTEKPFIAIENGSHPCLATQLGTGSTFIANDTFIGGDYPSTMLLTGPNMGGKSTLMRQVAVLTIMAHMGALVPAKSMKLSLVDRIFTRIGANDRIMCGQSTFFVEMNETQIIMRDATMHSLVLIDELGRGTSTFDGTAIASAVLDELASNMKCRTFFSTHYHSLCATAAANENIFQAHMACMVENENDDDPTEESVTFLYKLTEGACPKSYGFYAAKLAGIQDQVVRHAYSSSSRITKSSVLDTITRTRLREAAASGVCIEDLRRMIEAL